MQFPQLFGSDYILPAIVAIVLLAAVLALLMLRKKKPGGTVKQAGVPAALPVAKPTRASRKAAAAATAEAAAGERVSALGQEPEPEFRPAPASAVSGAGGATVDLFTASEAGASVPARPQADLPRHAHLQANGLGVHQSDPLAAVIASVLQGWGDLTPEDTNRLEVFRRDRVLAAIAAADLPKDLKGSEYARTRLIQLKRYANYLEQSEQPPTAGEPQFPGIGDALGTQGPRTQPTAAAAATATVATETVAGHPSEAKPVEFAWDETPPMPAEGKTPAEPSAGAVWSTELPESPAKVGREAAWTNAAEARKTTEEAVAAAAAAFWATPDAPRAEEAAAGGTAFGSSLSSLHGRVSTAADILALPAAERADMLAFLEPVELSKVFKSSDDTGLKRAVIDTLEHVGSPASLDVIQHCLEDSDPLIQMYALDAADRLLGASS